MTPQQFARTFADLGAMKPPSFGELYSIVFCTVPKRFAPKILEIGIHEGGSLTAWRTLFPEGSISGIDLKAIDVHLCQTYAADQCNALEIRRIAGINGPFDVVIDDGGHKQHEQRIAFDALWSFVKPGGWYVIEDVHVGRLPKYNPTAEQTTLDRWLDRAQAQPHTAPNQAEFAGVMFAGRCVAIRKHSGKQS